MLFYLQTPDENTPSPRTPSPTPENRTNTFPFPSPPAASTLKKRVREDEAATSTFKKKAREDEVDEGNPLTSVKSPSPECYTQNEELEEGEIPYIEESQRY